MRIPARVSVVAVVGVLAMTLIQAPARADGVWGQPRSPACADVAVFGLKGSGQNVTDPKGPGPEVRNTARAIMDSVTDLSYAKIAIPYSAAGVEAMYPTKAQAARIALSRGLDIAAIAEWKVTRLARYLASIKEGVGTLTTGVALRAAKCPDESLLFIGYSQGAAVIHQYLNQRSDQEDWDTLDRVAGVVLIADPDQVAGSWAQIAGSAPSGSQGVEAFQGSGASMAIKMPGPNRDVPEDLADITISVCNQGDIVCDWTPLNMVRFKRGGSIHTSYSGSDALAKAVELVSEFL